MKDCQRLRGKGRGRPALPGRFLLRLLLLPALLSLLSPVRLAGQAPPPDLRYLTLETEHFRITFPEGLGAVAPRAARVAEGAFLLLSESFFPPPAGKIDLLLTDHVDLSNGSAQVTPSNRITIWVHPPLDGLALSHFDDWLELVITHEVVHIFHLEYTGTLGRALRRIWGRPPIRWPYFAGYTLPPLAIEGVAVALESTHTLAGRAHGTLFEAVARTRALAEGAEPVARGLGHSQEWPGGERPYLYGGLFFEYLTETRGPEAVARFLRGAADQWIPYRLDAAAAGAFGETFVALWSEWMAVVEAEAGALAARVRSSGAPEVERLTQGERSAPHPAPAPGGEGVAYVRDDGRSDTRLVLRSPTGEERTLARWNDGHAVPRWTGSGEILLTDFDFVDRYRVRGELYRVRLDGAAARLTDGLRVTGADPRPGGGEIAAVLAAEEGNRLVLLSDSGALLRVLREAEPGVLWSAPAWSPSGDRLAVARRRPGGWTAILLLDPTGTLLHTVVEDRSLNTAPAWAPDGRALLWSSDRSGVPNIYGATFPVEGAIPDSPRQITDLATAGTFPAVDAAGEWIYLSVLGGDGWGIGRTPFDPSRWFTPNPEDPRFAEGGGGAPERSAGAVAPLPELVPRPYSPLRTLLPHYWLPILVEAEWEVGRRVLPTAWGAETAGSDLIGRHRYAARAALPPGDPGRRVEWGVAYRWAGLGNPVALLEAGGGWERSRRIVVLGEADAAADTLLPISRERYLGAAAEFVRSGIRTRASATLGARWIDREATLLEMSGVESDRFSLLRPSTTIAEGRASFLLSTARAHPLSISTEAGWSAALFLRQRWDRSVPADLAGEGGVDRSLREGVGVARAYLGGSGPGFANHVLALRLAGGVADGPGTAGGHFEVGGVSPTFFVRGHPAATLRGDRAWAATVEWRFPLFVAEWGIGSWPFYLDRVAGGVFLDAGGSRAEGGAGWEGVESIGAELTLTGSAFWEGLRRVRFGTALPLGISGGAATYVRADWAF